LTDPLPLKQCGGCEHWKLFGQRQSKDGFLEAPCFLPRPQTTINPAAQPYMRASDSCSQWAKPQPKPIYSDPYGYL
jgi:hypothetical protein